MKSKLKFLNRIPQPLVGVLAAAGALLYLILSLHYSQTQKSVLDEGLYLYKGWLFASGQYTIFQDYGPWSNHMPLSFLIPGWTQVLFGPGLQTGRLLAIGCGLLSVLGIWLLAHRFGGSWWAAGTVWAIALNPALIKMFSVQTSQGLSATILIWAMVFLLGEGRLDWQIVLGAILAAALPLTRINLLPVFPFSILYAYWVHGRRAGHLALGAGGLVFIAGHAVFWPGILRMWAPWFPDGLTPFLDPFRRPPNEGSLWAPEAGFESRVLSFLQGLRFHFAAMLGVLGTLIFFPLRRSLRGSARERTVLFLLVLLGLLIAMHAWASIMQNYCVFCFPLYLSFFMLLGLILLVTAFPFWGDGRLPGRWVLALLLLLGAAAGAGTFDTLGVKLLDQAAVVDLLKTEIPRISGTGTIQTWGFIENLTGRNFEQQVFGILRPARLVLMTLIGLLGAASICWIARRSRFPGSLGARYFQGFMSASLLLSPTVFLGGGYRTYDCSGDVIAAYEAAGAQLKIYAQPGDAVFWGTGNSPVPLLYLPDVRILPGQLNGDYSYKFGGDPDALTRFGHWNRALAEEWAAQSDVIFLSPAAFKNAEEAWLIDLVEGPGFRQVESTAPVHPCDPDSKIVIFVRK